jgi:1,4-dihydroxy-2-naphthoyl-CoA hydrolase
MTNLFPNAHMGTHLGIEVTEVGDDYIKARMPVGRAHQAALWPAARWCQLCAGRNPRQHSQHPVHRPHQRNGRGGRDKRQPPAPRLQGLCDGRGETPVCGAKTMHVWNIEIFNDDHKQVCASRLTCAIKKTRLSPWPPTTNWGKPGRQPRWSFLKKKGHQIVACNYRWGACRK